MHSAPSRLSATPKEHAARQAARKLALILILLALSLVPIYVYYQQKADAQQREAAIAETGGDPDRAPALFARYGCGDCHMIPNVSNATGMVGPDLAGIGQRLYVGGVITNTPDHLIDFIVDPRTIDEKSAMPATGITRQEARDVAAYLYAQRQ